MGGGMTPVIIGGATLYNGDCMEYMAGLEDKAFDLAIVDPPYGIKASNDSPHHIHSKKSWDNESPSEFYFSELKRVSNNQIVWGANYYTKNIAPTRGFIAWIKPNVLHLQTMADCELAFTSFDTNARIINLSSSTHEKRIHITQKPVALYEWLLTNYAKPGQTILDTHLGSGSSAIAANNLGFEFVGCELDADYFAAACQRIENAQRQTTLFAPAPVKQEQIGLAL